MIDLGRLLFADLVWRMGVPGAPCWIWCRMPHDGRLERSGQGMIPNKAGWIFEEKNMLHSDSAFLLIWLLFPLIPICWSIKSSKGEIRALFDFDGKIIFTLFIRSINWLQVYGAFEFLHIEKRLTTRASTGRGVAVMLRRERRRRKDTWECRDCFNLQPNESSAK